MKKYKRQKETPAILAGRIKQQQARADSGLTMTEAAKTLGIHRDTLKRWIKEGKIPDARRNSRNSYRMFTQEDVDKIRILMQQRKGMAINDEMDGRG
ncbi:MAG: MerR family transcriptional regulator [Nitrospira sp.]|nr:MerR family transcriptional regulator [Nitrospira sp.]